MPTSPLRVTLVADGFNVHHERFARAIRQHGHTVSVVRWDLAVTASRRHESLGGMIASTRPHVVLAGPIPTVAADVVSLGCAPVVATAWGSDLLLDTSHDAAKAARARVVLREASAVIVDSRSVQQAAEDLGAPPARLVRFPWGIDLAAFQMRPRARDRGSLKLASLRSLEPHYRVDVLLDASAQCDVQLSVVGGGSEATNLQRMAGELGIARRTRFYGKVSETRAADLLAEADIHVSTSPYDGTSVSLLQALAIGRPSIVVDNPSNREWISHRRTGWLYPSGDSAALADVIKSASASRSELAAMAVRGRRVVEREADWAAHSRTLVRTLLHAAGLR